MIPLIGKVRLYDQMLNQFLANYDGFSPQTLARA